MEPIDRALTLADLKEVKPQYICNTVVNGWRKYESEPKYGLLTMTPTEIERIQLCEQMSDEQNSANDPFAGKLKPTNIKLSAAMAMSAAAVSPQMGAYEQTQQSITHILTILGLEMGASMVYDLAYERNEHQCLKVIKRLFKFTLFGHRAHFLQMCYDYLSILTTDGRI